MPGPGLWPLVVLFPGAAARSYRTRWWGMAAVAARLAGGNRLLGGGDQLGARGHAPLRWVVPGRGGGIPARNGGVPGGDLAADRGAFSAGGDALENLVFSGRVGRRGHPPTISALSVPVERCGARFRQSAVHARIIIRLGCVGARLGHRRHRRRAVGSRETGRASGCRSVVDCSCRGHRRIRSPGPGARAVGSTGQGGGAPARNQPRGEVEPRPSGRRSPIGCGR